MPLGLAIDRRIDGFPLIKIRKRKTCENRLFFDCVGGNHQRDDL